MIYNNNMSKLSTIANSLLSCRRNGDNVLITGEYNSKRFAQALIENGIEVGNLLYPGCIVIEAAECGNTFFIWANADDIESLSAVWGEDFAEKLTDAYLKTDTSFYDSDYTDIGD